MADSASPIVVAIDFSPSCANALRHAVRLAKAMGGDARVLPIHVIDTIAMVPMVGEMSAFQAQITTSLIEEAKSLWAGWVKDMPQAAGLALHIDISSPVAAISQFCTQQKAGLLVMGTHGSFSGPGIGGVAGSCVRRAPCDVLLVHDAQQGPFQNLLACVDFSPTSRRALDQALRLVSLEGARLHVAHAYTPAWERLRMRGSTPQASEALQASFQAALLQQLEQFVGPARPEVLWAKPAYHAVPGKHHGKALAEFARGAGADLIVLGTRGASNLRDTLLGSTAERILRETQRSVLAVRP